MWNGKRKAVTFSLDDGILQDIRAIEIMDKYGIKCTFNLNSGLLGQKATLYRNGRTVSHDKVSAEKVKEIYRNHEIASHTLTHPNLRECDDETVVRQIRDDLNALGKISEQKVFGFAYPCGVTNEHIAEVIKNHTDVKYARTTVSTYDFALQDNLYMFNPTVHITENCIFEIADRFLEASDSEPRLLYIWGHSFEMDADLLSWENFEKLCNTLSGRSDIFYGTNSQVL